LRLALYSLSLFFFFFLFLFFFLSFFFSFLFFFSDPPLFLFQDRDLDNTWGHGHFPSNVGGEVRILGFDANKKKKNPTCTEETIKTVRAQAM